VGACTIRAKEFSRELGAKINSSTGKDNLGVLQPAKDLKERGWHQKMLSSKTGRDKEAAFKNGEKRDV